MAEPDSTERTKHMRKYDLRRQKRADRLFHWSLDMPPGEDDVNVQANRQIGMGWKELLVIGGLGLGGLTLFADREPPQSTPPPPAASPADSEYEVRFFDRDGNPITIPHLSTR